MIAGAVAAGAASVASLAVAQTLNLPHLLAQTARTVRWIAPPRHSLAHGLVWFRDPRIVVAVAIVTVVAILGSSLYRRFRRR